MNELDKFNLFAEHFSYCPNTGEFTRKKDGKVMVATSSGYVKLNLSVNKTKHSVMGHRMGWYLVYGEAPNGILDHVNRIRDDNRIGNLREVCSQRNARNSTKHSTGDKGRKYTSQYKGVRLLRTHYPKSGNPVKKPFQARIRLEAGGLDKSLGCFETELEAAIAYDKAAIEYFGEYAGLNFPCSYVPVQSRLVPITD